MKDSKALRQEIKQMMVEDLMLQVTADEIGDDQPCLVPEAWDSTPWTRSKLWWGWINITG